jgi:hypothetical protein
MRYFFYRHLRLILQHPGIPSTGSVLVGSIKVIESYISNAMARGCKDCVPSSYSMSIYDDEEP